MKGHAYAIADAMPASFSWYRAVVQPALWIPTTMMDRVEHFIHVSHGLRVRIRRNDPILNLAVGHTVFFYVARTVS